MLSGLEQLGSPDAVEPLIELLLRIGPDPPPVSDQAYWRQGSQDLVDKEVIKTISKLTGVQI